MMLIDFWKDIKNYEDKYSGSYWGNIRSWDRVVNDNGGKRFVKGRMLKPGLSSNGYLAVVLCNGRGKVTKKVHRLIAENFIPNPDDLPQVNHIVGVKSINFVPNLEWCTSSHNIRHAFKNGLSNHKGEKSPNAKLTEKQVVEIKRQLSQGLKGIDLAKQYGVHKDTISKIKIGRSWEHVIV